MNTTTRPPLHQSINVPVSDATTLCSCGKTHYWELGERIYECACGRLCFKGTSQALSGEYLYRASNDHLTIIVDGLEL